MLVAEDADGFEVVLDVDDGAEGEDCPRRAVIPVAVDDEGGLLRLAKTTHLRVHPAICLQALTVSHLLEI